ncbi:MAG: hypothetical protein IPH44_38920 [Myxococcales bacterium]|nr:hypothetical protein [Myxococcales bacterium]
MAVDGRADICLLGAMAFELFAGRLPFEAPSVVDVVAMHRTTRRPTWPRGAGAASSRRW